MGHKPQTRITVRVHGVERELLSFVDANNDGTLTILPAELPYRTDATLSPIGDHGVVNSKISVHANASYFGTTIKHTTDRDVGKQISHYTMIESDKRYTLWLTLARLQWRFDENEILASRPKDQVICVGEFDQHVNTLIYFVVVIGKCRAPLKPIFPFGGIYLEFRRYNIVVYVTSIPVPAPEQGMTIITTTNVPGEVGQKTPVLDTNRVAIADDSLFPTLMDVAEQLRKRYLCILERVGVDAATISKIEPETHFFGINRKMKSEN